MTLQSPWYLFPTDLIQKTEVAHHLSGEREFIRTEAVTEMLNQCRTAYYKDTGGASTLRFNRPGRLVVMNAVFFWMHLVNKKCETLQKSPS